MNQDTLVVLEALPIITPTISAVNAVVRLTAMRVPGIHECYRDWPNLMQAAPLDTHIGDSIKYTLHFIYHLKGLWKSLKALSLPSKNAAQHLHPRNGP